MNIPLKLKYKASKQGKKNSYRPRTGTTNAFRKHSKDRKLVPYKVRF